MKIEYELTKKEYEKIVRKVNSKYDNIYIIFASILYLIVVRDLILDNIKVVFLLYIGMFALIYALLKIANLVISKIFAPINEKKGLVKYGNCTLKTTKEKIIQESSDNKLEIYYKDILKTSNDGKYYLIYTKNIILILSQSLCTEEEYEKFVNIVEENKPKKEKKK